MSATWATVEQLRLLAEDVGEPVPPDDDACTRLLERAQNDVEVWGLRMRIAPALPMPVVTRFEVTDTAPASLLQPTRQPMSVKVLNAGGAPIDLVETPSALPGEGVPLIPGSEYATVSEGEVLWAITSSTAPVLIVVTRTALVEGPLLEGFTVEQLAALADASCRQALWLAGFDEWLGTDGIASLPEMTFSRDPRPRLSPAALESLAFWGLIQRTGTVLPDPAPAPPPVPWWWFG